jgi:hypothetical protein
MHIEKSKLNGRIILLGRRKYVFIDRYIIMTVTWKAVFMHGAVDDATLL